MVLLLDESEVVEKCCVLGLRLSTVSGIEGMVAKATGGIPRPNTGLSNACEKLEHLPGPRLHGVHAVMPR